MKRTDISIEVSDDYKIVVDSCNWMPTYLTTVKDEESKNFGKPIEVIVGYCSNLKNAVLCIVEDMVRKEMVPEEIEKVDALIGWYQGAQERLTNTILSRKQELQAALELNKTM